jgi:hypothetical protein
MWLEGGRRLTDIDVLDGGHRHRLFRLTFEYVYVMNENIFIFGLFCGVICLSRHHVGAERKTIAVHQGPNPAGVTITIGQCDLWMGHIKLRDMDE